MAVKRKSRRAPPTAEQDRAHERRMQIINAPFIVSRVLDPSYLWAGTLVHREREVLDEIEELALGGRTRYNGKYGMSIGEVEYE
jgi:hypothetical protein